MGDVQSYKVKVYISLAALMAKVVVSESRREQRESKAIAELHFVIGGRRLVLGFQLGCKVCQQRVSGRLVLLPTVVVITFAIVMINRNH